MVTFASVVLVASLGTTWVVPPPDPLHAAARTNDVERIRALLAGRMLGLVPGSAEAELNATGSGGYQHRTPLMVAAERGHLEAVRELLLRGADPSVLVDDPDLGKVSAWCVALMSEDGERAAELLEAQSSTVGHIWPPEAVCVDDAHLVAAVRRGSNSDVEFYLRGSPGQQALAYALDQSIGNHELDRVRPQLIARIFDKYNLDALQTAVRREDVSSLRQLADEGARVAPDRAIDRLSTGFSDPMRAAILEQLLRMTSLTTGQVSALSWEALNRDDLDTLEALAASNVWLGGSDRASWKKGDESALSLALASRDPQRAVRALLALGVELATGAAMARVAENGNCAVAAVLASAGAELNQVDENCATPGELAWRYGHGRLGRALEQATRKHPRLANPDVWCPETVERDPKERSPLKCE